MNGIKRFDVKVAMHLGIHNWLVDWLTDKDHKKILIHGKSQTAVNQNPNIISRAKVMHSIYLSICMSVPQICIKQERKAYKIKRIRSNKKIEINHNNPLSFLL